MADSGLDWLDILIFVLYMVLVLAVGIWASCRRAETDTSGGYFLAGRTSNWILIGSSVFATNVGAPSFIGIPSSAAQSGVAIVMFEWQAMWSLMILGWFFLPVFKASGCYSMPHFLQLRYGGRRLRTLLACIHTFMTIVSDISGQMYAGGLFIQIVIGWNLYVSVLFIIAITTLYTIIGGLTAVMWTDAVQTLILIAGATTLSILGMIQMGSFTIMRELFLETASNNTYEGQALYGNHTCGFAPADSFQIFRPATDPDYPWTGMVFGLTILNLHSWCTDQVPVQRPLSCKTLSHAKGGLIMAAYLKVLSFFFFMMPGLMARVLYPQEVACSDPETCNYICENSAGCYNIAYPMLVRYMLPLGLRGLMLAAMLAALMSSLTSTFNSSATVFTLDLWKLCRPHAKESEVMVVSRIWIVFLAFASMAWLPMLVKVQGSDFWTYSQSITSFITAPIVTIFIIGLLWEGTTETGAFTGLVTGLLIGIIRMSLEWSRPAPPCGDPSPSTAFKVVTAVNYLNFAIISFGCTIIVAFTVSLFTTKRPPEKLRRVTWWTHHCEEFQDVTTDSDDFVAFDDVSCDKQHQEIKFEEEESSVKLFLEKWFCGVDKMKDPLKLPKDEELALQRKMTDISQDPFWRRTLDILCVVTCASCSFLVFFWGWS